jgi:hypothetical protein
MEASEGPWSADGPYIVRPQRRNGRPRPEVYPARIAATQRARALNGSIAQWLFPA